MTSFWQFKDAIPNQTALIDQDRQSTTYEELNTHVTNLAKLLPQEKSLMLIMANNSTSAIVGYLAALQSKTALMLLPQQVENDYFETLLTQFLPQFIWTSQNFDNRFTPLTRLNSFTLYKLPASTPYNINPDLALILPTSGSTGSIKMVRLSYKNLAENAVSIASYLSLTSTERPITLLPMHYSYGLSIINSHLLVGATLLLSNDSVLSRNLWSFAEEHNCSSISGVPYTYSILHKIGFFEKDYPSIKTWTQAGGKMNKSLVQELATKAKEKNCRFFVMYGQTEATARISYVPPQLILEHPTSVGITIPGGTIHLIDDKKQTILAPNEPGEIVYSGPNVMMGYATNAHSLSLKDELNGTLYTGDIGQFDEEGLLYIVGRKSRFIKVSGVRIGLDELEKRIQTSLKIDAACGGKDDLLIVTFTDPDDKPKLQQLLSSVLKISPVSYTLEYVHSYPRNDYGKINYDQLFHSFLAQ